MNRPYPLPTDQSAAFAQLVGRAELVVFDFDGVIADSEVISLATLRDALGKFGVEMSTDETRNLFLGSSLETIKRYVKDHGQGDANAFPALWEADLFARFAAELTQIPQVFELVDQLDSLGQPYCIASSGTRRRIAAALSAMGCAHRFKHVFSAQQVARGKPAPDLFEFAAQHMGARPEACLVIEDSPHGIRAAKAAGMVCVGFTGGQHLLGRQKEHADLLTGLGADMVLPSYAGMAKLNILKMKDGNSE